MDEGVEMASRTRTAISHGLNVSEHRWKERREELLLQLLSKAESLESRLREQKRNRFTQQENEVNRSRRFHQRVPQSGIVQS